MEAYVNRGDGIFMNEEHGRHTIEEIYALPEGERAELIDGELYIMAGASEIHQMLVTEFILEIGNYIRNRDGKCKLFTAPFAVFPHNDDTTYLEPDIVVVCDEDKLDEKGCHGAPDFVIEIVSPSSKKLDYFLKLVEYQKAGVREYWIVDPEKQCILVYRLEKDDTPVMYHFTDKVSVGIFEELEIDFAAIDLE